MSAIGHKQSRSVPKATARSARASAMRHRHKGLLNSNLKMLGLVLGGAVFALAAIYFLNSPGVSGGGGLANKYSFSVGSPGPGKVAPMINLESTSGGMFDLGALRGQSSVLLFFQEGVMCQPCWDQIKDIEENWTQFQALGIDRIVSITTDPISVLKQKVAVDGLSTPILSDPGVKFSKTYSANKYGMMGDEMNGHSFVLVNKDGIIEWRRDYGGMPKHHMYLPVTNLIADLKDGGVGAPQQ